MREFVITADSTVDLPKQFLEEKQVPIVSLSYIIDGTTYKDGEGLTSKEFYDKIREGAMPTTSQVNPEQARDLFEPILKEGKDILHIAFTSGLSGTYNSCRIAAEELSGEYPDRKIIVVDSLCAASGGGLLLYKALELKAGIVEGNVADTDKIKEFASIPSREGLYTMLAGGMIAIVKDLSIALNLLTEQKEN